MRIFKKAIILVFAIIIAVGSFYFFYMRPRHVVPILMYHSVSRDKSSSLSVRPENFSNQMRYLDKAGYSVITLDELVQGIKKAEKFPPRTVVVTFDDGFEDNYLNAFPILAKYNMPAIIFLMTGYVDQKAGYLTWDQVKLMMQNDIDFGGHTRSGVYLPSIDDEKELFSEIEGSKKDLEKETGEKAKYFCYPIGGFNDRVKEAVKKSGYEGACTTNRGFDKLNQDVYELNRVKITDSDTSKPFHFKAKLSGYYNLFRSERKGD